MIALDIVLAALLVLLAGWMLLGADLLQATTLFVLFGVVAALAWVRLDAPDVALAEAAIGAGITGALLIEAARRRPERPHPVSGRVRWRDRAGALALAGSVAWTAIVAAAVLDLRSGDRGLTPSVLDSLGQTGVSHEVTAVLLSFRAYDTWLEIVVLLLAAIALAGLAPGPDLRAPRPSSTPTGVLLGYARLVAPLTVLVGAYLLLRGTAAPGGAFQAGALAGAGVVLGAVAGFELPARAGAWLRAGLAASALVFALVAGVNLVSGGSLLEYRGDTSAAVILILEAGVGLSVAVTLAALLLGSSPHEGDRSVERGG